jgi:hypothetical protein
MGQEETLRLVCAVPLKRHDGQNVAAYPTFKSFLDELLQDDGMTTRNCDSTYVGGSERIFFWAHKSKTNQTKHKPFSIDEVAKKIGERKRGPASLLLSSPGNHVVFLLSENMLE